MFKVYFAGDLFDQKHLTGNFLLAQEIETLSNQLYQCILPQEWEGASGSCIEMRNNDIKAIIHADLVLFNFDGPDLDSGTVVEFMIAKMLDIPVVLLRTDCRNGGYLGGEDWNLMVSGYPRSIIIKHLALVMYNNGGLKEMHRVIAESIISAFEKVRQEKSLLISTQEILAAYQYIIKMCGSDLEQIFTKQQLKEIVIEKIKKNIYSIDTLHLDKGTNLKDEVIRN